jgi:hypothetical protein
MSEMQLFSTMTFPEIYERVLVGPLFRPFAQEKSSLDSKRRQATASSTSHAARASLRASPARRSDPDRGSMAAFATRA